MKVFFQSPLSTHNFIERFVSDLEMAISKPEKEVVAQARGAPGVAPQWIPPVQGSLNVNVDAALSKNSNVAAMVAVARDEAGVFMGASALVLKGISDPETAEVLACREGLALATDLLSRRVCIATDCATVVKNLEGPGMGCYGQVIRELKAGMATFDRAKIVHEGRASNVDAHRLARSWIYETEGRHVWFLFPSDGVCISFADV